MDSTALDVSGTAFFRVDPDAPIYRIFPVWYFEEALRLRQLVLRDPGLWEDPYEILPSRVMVDRRDTVPWRQEPLEPHVRPAYAQCWSQTRESDALLRAYSRVARDPHFGRNTCPREEGVRVRSTPRKLLHALITGSPNLSKSFFIGAIRYLDAKDIHQRIANEIVRRGMGAFMEARARAELLLLKRNAFEYEAEVRLIYVEERDIAPEPSIHVRIDPNEVFEDVTYDSRLLTFERLERVAEAQKLGYQGSFEESELYRNVMLEVVVDRLPH